MSSPIRRGMLDIDPNQRSNPPGQAPAPAWESSGLPPVSAAPKERKSNTKFSGTLVFVGTLGIFMLLIGAGVWGLVYYKNQQVTKAQKEIATQDIQLAKLKTVEQEALALQAQYQNVSSVLEKRQIWQELINVLSSETLKKAVFSNLSAEDSTKNSMSLTGSTDSLTSLAKLMVAFQNSQNFTNFQLGSMTLPTKENPRVNFSMTIKFKKDIILPKTKTE